jgi:hypothetical protein
MAYTAAKLTELQNCASTLSNSVLQRGFASGIDGRCQRASRQRRAGKRGKGMKIMAIVIALSQFGSTARRVAVDGTAPRGLLSQFLARDSD